MNIQIIRQTLRAAIICGAAVLFAAGCNKKVDNSANFANAINAYYSAHPVCLWPEPIRFPVQVDTSDTSETSSYDALVEQGLLVRTTAEKKKMIIASKQVSNYDLSDKGRAVWTADGQRPGYGNFCYGHRKVSSIDSSTPTESKPGATTQVSFHYTVSDPAEWVTVAVVQSGFPKVRTVLTGSKSGQATLTNTSNGWQVSNVSGEQATSTTPVSESVQ